MRSTVYEAFGTGLGCCAIISLIASAHLPPQNFHIHILSRDAKKLREALAPSFWRVSAFLPQGRVPGSRRLPMLQSAIIHERRVGKIISHQGRRAKVWPPV